MPPLRGLVSLLKLAIILPSGLDWISTVYTKLRRSEMNIDIVKKRKKRRGDAFSSGQFGAGT